MLCPTPDDAAAEDDACEPVVAEAEDSEFVSAASARTPARAMIKREERILRGRHAGDVRCQPIKRKLDSLQLRAWWIADKSFI